MKAYIADNKDKSISICEIPYIHNQTNMDIQVKKLKACKPNAIAFFSPPAQARALLDRFDTPYLADLHILGIENLQDKIFQDFKKARGFKSYIFTIIPDLNNLKLSIIRDYQRDAKRLGFKVNASTLEAYLNGKLFFYLVKQIKGPVTKEALIKVVENIKDLDFGGLKLNFDPKTRQLLHTLWLDQGEGEWEEINVAKTFSAQGEKDMGKTVVDTKKSRIKVKKTVGVKEEKKDEFFFEI